MCVLECLGPSTRQGSQTPWEEQFNSVGETKGKEKHRELGLIYLCPDPDVAGSFGQLQGPV